MKLEKPRDIALPTGVLGLASAPDGSRLYAACMDGLVYEVDVPSGNATAYLGKHMRAALQQLETERRLQVAELKSDGKKRRTGTFPKATLVTFL